MNEHQPIKGPLSWRTIVLGILALGTFIAVSGPGVRYYGYGTMMGVSGGGVESVDSGVVKIVSPMSAGSAPSSAPSVPGGAMMRPDIYPYPYPNPEVPVTDTREFLKTYYSAMMRTRDVPALTRRVETTVRGYSGRIDQQSSSPKYGYVSFALPQAKYEAFRTELESLVGSRFLTTNISSQNLLAQKVSIEEQQKQADTTLADYKAARQKLVNTHASAVQTLQTEIDRSAKQLADFRATYTKEQIASNPQMYTEEQRLAYNLSTHKQQLASENASYVTQLQNADANIKYAQDWQKAVQTQDKTLLENVATVSGTVSIQWISFWETALLYLPGYWIPGIFTALTILSYLYDRRRAQALN